MSNPA